MTHHNQQTPEIHRLDTANKPRRLLYAGLLSGIGILLAGLHATHIIADIDDNMGIMPLVAGAIFPLLLALLIAGIGYWLWQSDLPVPQLRRIDIWFLFGIGCVFLFSGASVIYELAEGAQLTHIRYFLLNFMTAGGVVGILVGWYDAQNQLRTEQLRVFQKAVEYSGHSIYLTAPDGTIEYVNPQFETQTGYDWEDAIGKTPRILKSGEHEDNFYEEMWQTIRKGDIWEGEVTNQQKSGEHYVVNQTIAPVIDDAGEIERFAAIGIDITDKKRRQRELKRQRDELAQLHQLMATMWEVTQALVAATSESELKDKVCEALVSTEFCEVAWIGIYDHRTEVLTPAAGAGVHKDALETISLDSKERLESDVPYQQAMCNREIVVTRTETNQAIITPWRTNGHQEDYESTAAIPLLRDGLVYGMLSLHTDRSRAFDEKEYGQLEELGSAIIHGINTLKTQQLLHTDQAIELELQCQDEQDFFIDASRRTGCTISLQGTIPLSEERTLLYARIEGDSIDELRELVSARADIDDIRTINEEEDKVRLAFVVRSGATLIKRLMDSGAQVVDATVSDGEATVISHVSPDQDVRSLIERVQKVFPDLELIAKKETERPSELDYSILEELSDRQREALYAAYHAGYFGWPRDSTAEEVAEMMDISGPTFHKHLRRGEQLLLDGLLDTDSPSKRIVNRSSP